MKTNTLDFDAQALREKILDLAMHGKLVPQDPNDEPASVLLEKIKAEKEQLIKEKKIKKSKPLAPITDDEKPFDIPDSWEWVRLGNVGLLKNGKTPKKEDISSDNIYPYFKVKDMNNNNLYMENVKNWVGEKYSRQVMPKNTIIFPKNGGAILTAKKRILSQDSLVDLNTGGLIPYNDLNHKFIFYLFLSLDIKDFVKGSAVPTINSKKLKETLVPLPPLEEQSRIAAKIAQLFALLRKVESSTQQYAKLQTLLKSKVLDLAMRGKLVEQDPHDEPASVLLEKIKAEKRKMIKEKEIKKSKP
ncbi:MAG: restriction endonuclease subunit S, partial [Lactobacillus crispatus]|nr:restriction endonuclease subunit S [Lactobacillus crispatus]